MTPKLLKNHRVQWSDSKKVVNGDGQRVAKPLKIHWCQWFSRKKNIPSHCSQKITIAHPYLKQCNGMITVYWILIAIKSVLPTKGDILVGRNGVCGEWCKDAPLANPDRVWPNGVVDFKFYRTFPRCALNVNQTQFTKMWVSSGSNGLWWRRQWIT